MKPITPKELRNLLAPKKRKGPACQCCCCKSGRKLMRITAKLPPKERDWLRGLYDAYLDVCSELEMRDAAGRN